MFRKTFIRLILVIAVATSSLLVFAASKTLLKDKKECKDSTGEENEPSKSRTNFMILESIGLGVMKASSH